MTQYQSCSHKRTETAMITCDNCRTRAEHARRDAIQAAVILVTLRFGDEAGEWLLAQFEPLRGTPAMFAEYAEGEI